MSIIVEVYGQTGLAGGDDHSPLEYSYQICQNNDLEYSVTVTTGILRCETIAKNIENFSDAWRILNEYFMENEGEF